MLCLGLNSSDMLAILKGYKIDKEKYELNLELDMLFNFLDTYGLYDLSIIGDLLEYIV